MKTILTLSGLVLTTVFVIAVASPENTAKTNQASNKDKPKSSQHQQHSRGAKMFALTEADGAKITLWKPDLTTIPLEGKHLKNGTITLPRTGLDNYHAIVAEKDWGDSKEAIVRYEYLRGRPSKNSPTILSDAVKTEFEIVPDPIPRGHYHYYTDQKWNFITRFKGKPIPNLPVIFQTSNGSRIEAKSDTNGRFNISIPTDFPDLISGERDKRSSDFMLTAEYKNKGISYQSALSAEYRINRLNWRSVEWGFAVVGIGIVGGGLLRRKIANKGVRT